MNSYIIVPELRIEDLSIFTNTISQFEYSWSYFNEQSLLDVKQCQTILWEIRKLHTVIHSLSLDIQHVSDSSFVLIFSSTF